MSVCSSRVRHLFWFEWYSTRDRRNHTILLQVLRYLCEENPGGRTLTVIKIAMKKTNSFLRRQPAATEYFRNSTDIERHSLKISLSTYFVRTYRSNFSVFLFPLLLKILCVLGNVGDPDPQDPHVFGPPRCKCKNVANISKFFKFVIDKYTYVQISAVMIFIIWLSNR
jgi:hypothetical protein